MRTRGSAARERPVWLPHAAIVAMTTGAYPEDRDACRRAGMDDFVPKPVDPDLLYRTVLRWLTARG